MDYALESDSQLYPSLPPSSPSYSFEAARSTTSFAHSEQSTSPARSPQDASRMLETFFSRKRASGEPVSEIEQEGVMALMHQGRSGGHLPPPAHTHKS
jgi:hypothetical protein